MSKDKDKRGDSSKQADDDGLVTSAPASNVGNLLTDLLSSVKKDVEQERQDKVESEASKRERQAREDREREEARLRMAAQERLIEESRLRNESLNKAKGSDPRPQDGIMATGQHIRPAPAAAVAVTVAPVEASKVGPPPSRGNNWLLTAALVLVGLGVGFGGAFAVQPEQKAVFPDIDKAARTTVGLVAKAARVEVDVRGSLSAEADKRAALEAKVETLVKAQQALEAQVAEQAETIKELEAEGDKSAPARPRRPPRRDGGSGLPGLNTGIY